MSILYLHFEGTDRAARLQKLEKSGARVVVTEPRWPGFFEVAKKEKPYAIAIDFSRAPSHALETADYLAKAKETRETPIYLLQVPGDRLDVVKKRLPHAALVTEQELSGKLVEIEREAELRARQKKEAAAEARREKRSRARAASGEKAPPPAPPRPIPAKPRRPAIKTLPKKKAPAARKAAPGKKAPRPAKKK